MDYKLVPQKDVSEHLGEFLALTDEPWLEFVGHDISYLAGKFVEIKYSGSYFDDPSRPIFRFQTSSGFSIDYIAPAPVMGSAIWIGRVPRHAQRLCISPTNKTGAFSFMIEAIRQRQWISLIAQGFYHTPRAARSTVLTLLLGWRQESDNNLAWAIGSTRLSRYRAWRAKRDRPLDLTLIDRPHSRWDAVDPIHLWLAVTSSSDALNATIASLQSQIFSYWILHIVVQTPLDLPDDMRLQQECSTDSFGTTANLSGALNPGDELPPYSLACLHETAHRYPEARLFYGDEEFQRPDGTLMPVLKTNWDPFLSKQLSISSKGLFLRGPVQDFSDAEKRDYVIHGKISSKIFAQADRTTMKAIRRILLKTKSQNPLESHALQPKFDPDASVCVIIPTKNHADFLKRAMRSIHLHRGQVPLHLVIIDNGSTDDETQRLLKEISQDKNSDVIAYPGPFNFSAMCNAGAAQTHSDVLLFLNNDIEVLSADWLERIKAWALQPDIGAVGAKLTYPDGRIQHIGVLLGMGGSAGHFGSLVPPEGPSWANRSAFVHQVSAVTGACLAVERQKFNAIGGFDAENFPVELSDIDFCLRLAEKGWGSIVDPAIHLMHKESASRGRATFRRLNVYQDQRTRFINRWQHVLRDDPYFHPALSLYYWSEALG